VESRATLVGPTSIGARSVVAPGALVFRSAVWNGCRVEAKAVVDRGILADKYVVRAGARVSGFVRPPAPSERRPSPQPRTGGPLWFAKRLVPAWFHQGEMH